MSASDGFPEPARVAAADDLAERLAFLAAIIESSDDAIVSKSLDGVIRSWNAGAMRIFGYTAAEMIGRHITTIIPAELHDEERYILEKIRNGERVEHFDTVRIAKDGHRIPVSLTVSPIRDANGTIIGASKIGRDISERQRSEQQLRDSRGALAAEAGALVRLSGASTRLWQSPNLAAGLDEILRTVVELMGASQGNVQLMDEQRKMLVIAAHTGFPAEFIKTFQYVSPTDAHAACGRALRAGRPVVIEDVAQDAQYAPYLDVARAAGYRAIVSVPLVTAERAPLGAITVHFPVPHRPGDAEMRRLTLYSIQASDFIQRARLEQGLRARDDALLEADRRKNEFLALLAHELRNPLAPIRYALGAVRKPGATHEQKECAEEIIERQVAHMSRLLDDLLDIARITRGTLELKTTAADLASVIGASVEAAQPYLDSKGHDLRIELPDRPVSLVADVIRLAQVFSNLLINSAKYTPNGGRIEIAARPRDDEVVVTVRDNGIGISAEMMPNLFTLFMQSRPPLERFEQGLGVGLGLARALVTLHGGSIAACSEGRGRGSEFCVTLPVGPRATMPVVAGDGLKSPAAATLSVLVVDDNRDVADSCAMLLELAGHSVHTAYDGAQALEMGENRRPNVVVLDVGLPDMNGYEVARRIRSSEWGRKLPLVALTGWGRGKDRELAAAAGFDHHLTKPVAPEALEALLRSLAEKIRAA